MRYKDACEIAKEVLKEITESDNAVCYITINLPKAEEKTNDSCWKEYYESKFMKKV